jgi:hypothetical protein
MESRGPEWKQRDQLPALSRKGLDTDGLAEAELPFGQGLS